MQAVILAGGLGTRLWPITRDVPKPMVPVAGVPYLHHQLKLLGRQSIRDVVLLIGYLGEQIQEHFGDGRQLDLHIRYSREPQPLGTGGALALARDMLAERFLLIYGDSFLPINYARVLAKLDLPGVAGVMVTYDNRHEETSVRNNVAVDAEHMVVRYDKQALDDPELTYVEAGVLAFRRSIADLLPVGRVVSLEQEIFPQLIARHAFIAFPTAQRFYDIGTPERLRQIEEYLSHDHHADSVSN